MMRWIGVGLAVFAMFILAPTVGLHSQAWSTFWFAGSNLQPAGVVPAPAQLAPQGPLLSDTSALMQAIQPYMGVRYVFGGNDRSGIDCSGLTVAVFRALGISLPRTAQAQYDAVRLVDTGDLQVGDLLFYQRTYTSPDRITHVAIYVGGGMQISAIEPVVGRQSLGDAFWRAHYAGAGRVRH